MKKQTNKNLPVVGVDSVVNASECPLLKVDTF